MPSEKILNEKKKFVENLTEDLKSACSGVLVEYKGISVEADTKLRKELRENKVKYRVIKNSMLLRACKQAGLEGLDSALKGPTALAISSSDHVAPAKVICGFAKDNDFFKVKLGFLDGEVVSKEKVEELSKLPSKELLVAQALAGFNAPITGFVTVLSANIKGLLVALSAIAEKKQ